MMAASLCKWRYGDFPAFAEHISWNNVSALPGESTRHLQDTVQCDHTTVCCTKNLEIEVTVAQLGAATYVISTAKQTT